MKTTRLLLVEGDDDRHVCDHFIKKHNLPVDIKVENAGGISGVLEALPVRLKGSGLRSLGVVVDADTDVGIRWQQLRTILLEQGWNAPRKPHVDGVITTDGRGFRVGVWIMPDNTLPGEIEHFVSFLVPESDDLWRHAKRSVGHIPVKRRRFKEPSVSR